MLTVISVKRTVKRMSYVDIRAYSVDDAEELAKFWSDMEYTIPGGTYEAGTIIDKDFVLESYKVNKVLHAKVAVKKNRIIGYYEIRQDNPHSLWVCYLYTESKEFGLAGGSKFFFTILQYIASNDCRSFNSAKTSYCPGNRTAYRLYKAFGIEESQPGQLVILLPIILKIFAFRKFAKKWVLFEDYRTYYDLYSRQIEGVIAREPEDSDFGWVEQYYWNEARVYPLKFQSNDDWIEILVDAVSLNICYIATPSWNIYLRVSKGTKIDNVSKNYELKFENLSSKDCKVRLTKEGAEQVVQPKQVVFVKDNILKHKAGNIIKIACKIKGNAFFLGTCVQ